MHIQVEWDLKGHTIFGPPDEYGVPIPIAAFDATSEIKRPRQSASTAAANIQPTGITSGRQKSTKIVERKDRVAHRQKNPVTKVNVQIFATPRTLPTDCFILEPQRCSQLRSQNDHEPESVIPPVLQR